MFQLSDEFYALVKSDHADLEMRKIVSIWISLNTIIYKKDH